MNQTNTANTVDLFRAAIGRSIQAKSGVLLINDVLTHKTGVLKDGSKAPYLHLVSEMGDQPEVDLHPQKALELLKKGECGAYKILGALAAESTVAPEIVAAMNEVAPADEAPTMELHQVEEPAAPAAPATAESAPAEEKKESKKAGTIRLFKEGQAAGLARKDIIAKMRTELGLSVPGANTYYQNCKSGMWA